MRGGGALERPACRRRAGTADKFVRRAGTACCKEDQAWADDDNNALLTLHLGTKK